MNPLYLILYWGNLVEKLRDKFSDSMVNLFKLQDRRNSLITTRWEWGIIWTLVLQLDVILLLRATWKQSWWIWKLYNGRMVLTSRLHRKKTTDCIHRLKHGILDLSAIIQQLLALMQLTFLVAYKMVPSPARLQNSRTTSGENLATSDNKSTDMVPSLLVWELWL